MDSKDEGPRPGRGLRFRFGLRSLLLLVLAIGSGLGWVVLGAREQRDLVAHIRSIGGAVGYEGERNRISPDQVVVHRLWPTWLVRRLGPDYFHGVTNVNLLLADKVDGDLLVRISRLKSLKTLDLCEGSRIKDGDLASLSRLPNLEELWLRGPTIRGDVLKSISHCGKLRKLYVNGIHLTDDDLSHLSGLTSLRAGRAVRRPSDHRRRARPSRELDQAPNPCPFVRHHSAGPAWPIWIASRTWAT